MNPTNPAANFFFAKQNPFQKEINLLREILLSCHLTEELKWGCPCYTASDDRNIVLIHVFKEYCALLFFQGALLKDEAEMLIQQTENVQAARQLRYTNPTEIEDQKDLIKAYIFEAVENEEAGKKVKLKERDEPEMAEELVAKIASDVEFKKAFEALTPGRQRAYNYHIASAKQAKTRAVRVEKAVPDILAGIGFNEAYKTKS